MLFLLIQSQYLQYLLNDVVFLDVCAVYCQPVDLEGELNQVEK